MVMNSQGVPVVMSRNCEIVLTDDKQRERARFRVPYGARLLVDEGQQVARRRSWRSGIRTPCRSSPSAPARWNTST